MTIREDIEETARLLGASVGPIENLSMLVGEWAVPALRRELGPPEPHFCDGKWRLTWSQGRYRIFIYGS